MKRLKQGAAALTGVLLLLSGCSGGVDEYQCVHPETGTLVQQLVEGTGTVSYREEYSVIPTVSAKILSCSIEEGDTVTAGQVLYVLDSGALEDQITQARLSLEQRAGILCPGGGRLYGSDRSRPCLGDGDGGLCPRGRLCEYGNRHRITGGQR